MNISKENIIILQDYFKGEPVFKAFVFGSFARGDADKNSDYDILVELDYSKKIGLGKGRFAFTQNVIAYHLKLLRQ